MHRHTLLSRLLIGAALMVGLAAAPAQAARAAQPGPQTNQAPITPFSGTATLTYTSSDSLVPTTARNDLARSEQDETFAVRDTTRWRVDVHVLAPVIDSQDETIVADGHQVVAYSTVFNRAYRLPGGVTHSWGLLSTLLQSRGAPLGTTTAQFIQSVKSNPGMKVRSRGQAQVAGQTADVLQISPIVTTTTGPCTGPKDCAKKEKGQGSATIWLDHEHGVVLQYEEQGIPQRFGATQGYKYLVRSITFGRGPSDTDLAYVPPIALEDLPQNALTATGGGGGGPGAPFQAPPGFITVRSPVIHAAALSPQGFGYGGEWLSAGPSFVQGVFRGDPSQGFVYVKERIRALGLPSELTAGSAETAGSCQVWTGTFPDGLTWLAMMRGSIAILVVANKLTQADLVQYAASGICTAPIVPRPSAQELLDTTLDHLETEIDITRQILGWVMAAAPSAADKTTLQAFDARLESFDRTVFAMRHRGDPQAVYSPPSFPPPQQGSFTDEVAALEGEIPAAKAQLAQAEAAVQSPADRQTLEQQGAVFDDLIRAVDAMVSG